MKKNVKKIKIKKERQVKTLKKMMFTLGIAGCLLANPYTLQTDTMHVVQKTAHAEFQKNTQENQTPKELTKEEVDKQVFGEFGVAINAENGEVLYGKKENEQAFPASMTKVMTAILLMEHTKPNEVLTASLNAANQEASNPHFKLTAGEKLTREEALKSMMILSANDVAYTIAEHVGGGSSEKFAEMMTAKAHEIGATHTNFVTPNGLHDPNHYTTAYDMALIVKEALKYPEIVEIMGTKKAVVKTDKQEKEITNPSKIHDNPLAIGGKTGYTNAARNTLTEILEKDGKKVIAVVMKSSREKEYDDIINMGNYAFDSLVPMEIAKKGEKVGEEKILGKKVNVLANEDVVIHHKKGEKPKLQNEIKLAKQEKNVAKGQEVGTMLVKANGTVQQEVPVVADRKIVKPTEQELTKETGFFGNKYINIAIAVFIPLFAYTFVVVRINKRKSKNKPKYAVNKK